MNSWPSMSPRCIVGMNPLYMCRSEPQIAVEVIFTIASRWLRICGSGTCSTLIVVLPYQQFALIASPFPLLVLVLQIPPLSHHSWLRFHSAACLPARAHLPQEAAQVAVACNL